ncbi:restriction endonuclease subunit S [Escherichia coli]|uniref:restriction endonuclease subunit S n=1 Tax=Escherichia coli TaxID=562 RepID=UPI000BB665A8|nr:restriction endonuclease subunit S [Escherichia coli]EHT8277093.1 restriction endonuclease subunit S [Escherichia coli]PBR58230.1 type I restriction endonuclease subunit S [Escherichia coli]HAG5915386.1 restriction endonuclease subunit S [Escherichia coli]HBP9483514.1 restriction endonuclease subunit S [Escherichia coli]
MGSNYIEMRLEDCMDAIIDYRGKTPKKIDNGIPLITAKIIKNGRIQEVNEFIAIDDYDDWMVRGLPLEGDVVLTTEAPLGEVAQLDARKVALAQRVITLRGKKGILENDYLLYLLQSSFVQNQLDGRASGSTVTGIKQSELREIILRLPPVSLQKSISHQLKCLDKKIDLNNKINKTLEQMSQTLFKSWFVDFDPVVDNALDAGNPIPEALHSRAELRQKVRNSADFKPLPAEIRSLFPSEFEETEPGWLPKGWKHGNLNDVTKILSGFAFKSKDFGDEGKSVIKIKNINIDKTIDIDHTQKISDIVAKDVKRFQLFDGDILMAMTGATVGKFGILASKNHEEYYLNQRVAKFETDKKAYLYCILNQESTERFIINTAQGSAQPNISAKDILSIPLTLPSNEIITIFNTFVDPLFYRMIANTKVSLSLTELRDTLLPKLISGELSLEDLPDLNTDTEAA